MSICPDCGRELQPDELFCPLCGAKVLEEEVTTETTVVQTAWQDEEGTVAGFDAPLTEEIKPKRKAVAFLPIAVGCAVVLGVAIWLAVSLLASPHKAFLAEHQKLLKCLSGDLTPSAQSTGDPSRTNVDMTITARVSENFDEYSDVLNDLLEDSAVNLRLDGDKERLQMEADLVFKGDMLLNGVFTYDRDNIVGFQVPQLSENYYTMDYFRFLELQGGKVPENPDRRDISPEAWEKSMKVYGNILVDVVNRNNVTKEKGTFRSYGDPGVETSGTAYTFRPNAGELEDMFLRLADALEKDETLRVQLNDKLDWYAYGDSADPATKLANEMRDNSGEMAQTIVDSGFAWTLRVGRNGVYQGEMTWRNGQEGIRYERLPGFFYLAVTWESKPVFDLNVTRPTEEGTDYTCTIYDEGNSLVTWNIHTSDHPVTLTAPDSPRVDITEYTAEDFEALGEEFGRNLNGVLMKAYMKMALYQ